MHNEPDTYMPTPQEEADLAAFLNLDDTYGEAVDEAPGTALYAFACTRPEGPAHFTILADSPSEACTLAALAAECDQSALALVGTVGV